MVSKSRLLKYVGVAYLIGLLPANYVTTAIDTGVDMTKPQEVVERITNNDLSTFLAGGLPQLDGLSSGGDASTQSNNGSYNTPHGYNPDFHTVTEQAEIHFDPAPGEYIYLGLDELGRTTGAYAMITDEDRAAAASGDRDGEDLDDPSGWPVSNEEVDVALPDGDTYHGWFWNRSHLIADSLGGSSEQDNLVTGTRMQNVGDNSGDGGMAYTESMVRSYLDNNSNAGCDVYYSVLPNYQADELIPRTVTVDVRTCDGEIDQNVVVDNVMPGYAINYHTGEWTEV